LLEELIEENKPAPAGGRLHYLLSTPFRYPPLRHGSRFGARGERGIWYGAETQGTVFAEVAYYRLLFLEGTRADLGLLEVQLTAFTARIRAERGIDLTVPPFDRYREAISSPSRYESSQALGKAMRSAGVEAFRYFSARDPRGGVGLAVMSPSAFARPRPSRLETWHCTATRERVEMRKADFFERAGWSFRRVEFLVRGRLPAPAT
jgi:hypothetical protein